MIFSRRDYKNADTKRKRPKWSRESNKDGEKGNFKA